MTNPVEFRKRSDAAWQAGTTDTTLTTGNLAERKWVRDVHNKLHYVLGRNVRPAKAPSNVA